MYKIILTDFLVLNQFVLVGSIFFSVVDIIFFMYNWIVFNIHISKWN